MEVRYLATQPLSHLSMQLFQRVFLLYPLADLEAHILPAPHTVSGDSHPYILALIVIAPKHPSGPIMECL
jgi:hypothetical protein